MSFKLNNGQNRFTEIYVCGEREAGGAFATYTIHEKADDDSNQLGIRVFQSGPVKEAGVNGIFLEDLIDICVHRLTCFQSGPFACKENENAIQFLQCARGQLANRTADRQRRGVEGTMQA